MIGLVTYVLEEHFQNTTGLLIDKTRDTLDTATASKTTNGLSVWNDRLVK